MVRVAPRRDGKGRASDNVFTERLWRSLNYEEVYLKGYQSPREAKTGITRYLDFYNHERLHRQAWSHPLQALGYQTPAELYFGSAQQTATTTTTHQTLTEGRKCSLNQPRIAS